MTHSLNETEALCRKAARGAGYSWGLAEDAGRAVRWLEARSLPGAAGLAAWLGHRDGGAPRIAKGQWRGEGGRLCPLITGAALSDRAESLDLPLAIAPLPHPLLLVPFAALAAAQTDSTLRLAWPGARIDLGAQGLAIQATPDAIAAAGPVTLQLHRVDTAPPPEPTPGRRAHLDAGTLGILEVLAQRTYAPATEASRKAGAGAGLTDND